MSERYLVTGAMGCIGAWTVYHLLRQGKEVVSFDIATEGHRLDLLLSKDEQQAITFIKGDLSDYVQVAKAFADHDITHVVHLAALQVPFCKADPVRGAQVNVVGTVNIFEAARQQGLKHISYASSIAVFGGADKYPTGLVASDALHLPTTLYGVYKSANEGTAKVYWQDHKISSTTLRAYTVYGLGRDQGLTSDPTKAMLAAAAGQPFQINFGGVMQFQWASDVAQQFIEAARVPLNGAYGFNLGGEPKTVDEVVEMIQRIKPDAQIKLTDTRLPFPEGFDDADLKANFNTVYETPLEDGIQQTIAQFENALAKGLVKPA